MHAGTKLPSAPHEITELITDAVRFAEGLLTEAAVRKKWRLNNAVWTALANNELFIEKIEAEKLRRIKNGDVARERAQRHFAVAPDVLGTILHDSNASPHHRLESAKELRVVAANGPDAAQNSDERFIININIGDTRLRIDKSIKPNPNDVDGSAVEIIEPPQELLAIAATKNREEGNGG